MREILIVLRVPEPGEPDYLEHDPQDGDTLLEITTIVRRGTTTYQQQHPRGRAAILSFDRLVDYVGRVVASVEEHRDSGGN